MATITAMTTTQQIVTRAITPTNGIGHVCGITSVSSNSPHAVHLSSFVPLEKAVASLITLHSPSSCPVGAISSV